MNMILVNFSPLPRPLQKLGLEREERTLTIDN